MLKKHIAEWIIFTVAFALLPLCIFLLFSAMLDNSPQKIIDKSFHELFFYSIMVSSTTINDLLHVEDPIRETWKFTIAFGFIIFLLIASTSVYGMILFNDNFSTQEIIASHLQTMFVCSIIFGVFVTFVSFLVINWRYS